MSQCGHFCPEIYQKMSCTVQKKSCRKRLLTIFEQEENLVRPVPLKQEIMNRTTYQHPRTLSSDETFIVARNNCAIEKKCNIVKSVQPPRFFTSNTSDGIVSGIQNISLIKKSNVIKPDVKSSENIFRSISSDETIISVTKRNSLVNKSAKKKCAFAKPLQQTNFDIEQLRGNKVMPTTTTNQNKQSVWDRLYYGEKKVEVKKIEKVSDVKKPITPTTIQISDRNPFVRKRQRNINVNDLFRPKREVKIVYVPQNVRNSDSECFNASFFGLLMYFVMLYLIYEN